MITSPNFMEDTPSPPPPPPHLARPSPDEKSALLSGNFEIFLCNSCSRLFCVSFLGLNSWQGASEFTSVHRKRERVDWTKYFLVLWPKIMFNVTAPASHRFCHSNCLQEVESLYFPQRFSQQRQTICEAWNSQAVYTSQGNHNRKDVWISNPDKLWFFTILFLQYPKHSRQCFVAFQTLQSSSKILDCASYFQLSFRKFGNVKNVVSLGWCNLLNTQDRVWAHFQSPKRDLKIRHAAGHIWRTSREMWSNLVLNVISMEVKIEEKRSENGDKKSQDSKLIKITHPYTVTVTVTISSMNYLKMSLRNITCLRW